MQNTTIPSSPPHSLFSHYSKTMLNRHNALLPCNPSPSPSKLNGWKLELTGLPLNNPIPSLLEKRRRGGDLFPFFFPVSEKKREKKKPAPLPAPLFEISRQSWRGYPLVSPHKTGCQNRDRQRQGQAGKIRCNCLKLASENARRMIRFSPSTPPLLSSPSWRTSAALSTAIIVIAL